MSYDSFADEDASEEPAIEELDISKNELICPNWGVLHHRISYLFEFR